MSAENPNEGGLGDEDFEDMAAAVEEEDADEAQKQAEQALEELLEGELCIFCKAEKCCKKAMLWAQLCQ